MGSRSLAEMRPVYVVGVGLHRYQKPSPATFVELGLPAVRSALGDAGIAWAEVESAYVGTVNLGMAAGWTLLRHLGATGIPVAQVENASATGSTAFRQAAIDVACGLRDVSIAVGVDKLGAPKLAPAQEGRASLAGHALFPAAHFALLASRHMAEHGTTLDQLALVSVKNHRNGALNPYAQYQKECSLQEVHAARPLVDPFTTLHCCPFGEGAAAAIVASEEALARLGIDRARAIRIAASASRSERIYEPGVVPDVALTREAAGEAYEQASLGPEDLDVVEVHDAFTIEEILYAEALGLCAEGEGGRLVESGETAIGGRCAVSTSGGLLAMGHPFGPTGVGQVAEIVTQLRGEASARQHPGARVGLAHMLGLGAVCLVHVLARD
jgi:acetyl-CoA acetyltransferase